MILWVLIGLVATAWIIGRWRRAKGKAAASHSERHPLDAWIEQALARDLARKLDLESNLIAGSLDGAPEPEMVSTLEEKVRGVEVRFSRLPQGDDVEVRVETTLETGDSCVATKRMGFADLPQPVRDEFTKTAAAMVFRRWDFPWVHGRTSW